MKTQDNQAKQAVGFAAAEMVQEGMLVGLGTGSTAAFFIQRLGQRCVEGLKIKCVATSVHSWKLGEQNCLSMIDMSGITRIDLTVDGADEIDHDKNMIKGGGGALLREKILASISHEMLVVVDSGKVVQHLGAFPLAVEVVDFGCDATIEQIRNLQLLPKRRVKDGKAFVTDGGNCIVDIDLSKEHRKLFDIDRALRQLPGVVETGYFSGLAGRVLIGHEDGRVEMWD
ncbi:MAG: ribose-5-phosphate isomerase RpiA [Chlamydiales bacterium]|nr:ribose-5-phosphate isomerase RpiA [Chlamydiales bacterium]